MVRIDDPRGRWSVQASHVLRIVTATEWVVTPAIDVLAGLGPLPWSRSRRVLVLRVRGREVVALVAAGAIAIEEVAASAVLPLPGELVAATPQVSAVVVAPDASLSLLIEPSAVIASGAPEVGEEPCPSHS
jgi:chemotaxis signal transduction protein